MIFKVLTGCFLVGLSLFGFSQKPKEYVCYTSATEINIDGKLDSAEWGKALWTNYFVDIEGDKREMPRFNTRVKMLWDNNYLYVAAELEEPHVWATLTEDETIIFYDNDFEIFFDPNGDTHNYYEIEINAFETLWDLLLVKPYRDGGPATYGFNLRGIKKAVHINGTINNPTDIDKSWTVEFAIPWNEFDEYKYGRLLPKDGDYSRINFSRVQWKEEIVDGKYQKQINPETNRSFPEDNWVWSPHGKISMHMPDKWGYIMYSDKIAGEENVDFIEDPYYEVKTILRDIYYKQYQYRCDNNVFCNDINLLVDTETTAKYNLLLQAGDMQYVTSIITLHDKVKWFINQEGKVWKEYKYLKKRDDCK